MHAVALGDLLAGIIDGELRDFLEQRLQCAATCPEVLEAVLCGLCPQDSRATSMGQAQLHRSFFVLLLFQLMKVGEMAATPSGVAIP